MIGLGAISAEAIYCGIPLFGVASFSENNIVFDIMYVVIIPVLFFLGVQTIRNRRKGIEPTPTDMDKVGVRKSRFKSPDELSYSGLYIYGFLLCASNPMTFIFWVNANIMIHKNGWIDDSFPSLISFYIGVPIGTFILYACFAQLAHVTRRRISTRLRIKLNNFVGIVFIVLAFYLLLKFLELKDMIQADWLVMA